VVQVVIREWFVVWPFCRVARVCRVVDVEVFECKLTESGTLKLGPVACSCLRWPSKLWWGAWGLNATSVVDRP